MPLYKRLNNRDNTRVLVWRITETEASLRRGLKLSKNSLERLAAMSSKMHRKGFLSIRHLMKEEGYLDDDLIYSQEGKPHLRGSDYISITHSFEFTAIILSDKPVGIDIEKQREKINRIAPKFIGSELSFIQNHPFSTRALTVIWGVKESMYKLYGKRGLGFKAHCDVTPFDLKTSSTVGTINHDSQKIDFDAYFLEIEGFTLVYVLPK